MLNRTIKRGDAGPDVLAVKRALKAAGYGRGIVLNRKFGSAVDRQLRRWQKNHALPVDGVYGEKTHKTLLPWFDDYGKKLLEDAPKSSPEEERFNRLLSFMEKMARDTPGYVWGGGHSEPLNSLKTTDGMDCSSSCSFALWHEELFHDDWAWVSGTFERYGLPGGGEFFTVYANADHVWIRLHKGPYWRFDTSPHGDGGRGPRLRKLPRFTSRFVARHHAGY